MISLNAVLVVECAKFGLICAVMGHWPLARTSCKSATASHIVPYGESGTARNQAQWQGVLDQGLAVANMYCVTNIITWQSCRLPKSPIRGPVCGADVIHLVAIAAPQYLFSHLQKMQQPTCCQSDSMAWTWSRTGLTGAGPAQNLKMVHNGWAPPALVQWHQRSTGDREMPGFPWYSTAVVVTSQRMETPGRAGLPCLDLC